MQAVIFGIFVMITLVIVIIERRIGKEPVAERSDAEKKFMSADQSAAQGMNLYFSTISPVIAALAGLGLLVFGIVWLTSGQERAGWVGIFLGSMFLLVGIFLIGMRNQRNHNGK